MHIKNQWQILGNAEDCYIVIPMYSLLEYSDKFSMTSESLWNYYRDEVNDAANENDIANDQVNNDKTATSKSFEYKTKLMVSTPAYNNTLVAEFSLFH